MIPRTFVAADDLLLVGTTSTIVSVTNANSETFSNFIMSSIQDKKIVMISNLIDDVINPMMNITPIVIFKLVNGRTSN